ncbi:MAG TPA: type I-U CRISPR-associated helicase/endonuclease Cas3, partial [Chthoniobacteraceae bacterium]
IVNRRTVVDQSTAEAKKLRDNIGPAELTESLAKLCATLTDQPLAISTLRGQFADNREWSADPCRPAVIIGTVDMMGSRLLFGGYRLGFKTKPLHAGFLGQDTLIVHDEAHLEPAFQELLTALESEQQRCGDARKVRVMELSATPRSAGETFRIGPEDEAHPEVAKRLGAVKKLALREVADASAVVPEILAEACRHLPSGRAVLVFANAVKDVEQIAGALEKDAKGKVQRLTGTMRGKERDGLVKSAVFRRFLPPGDVPADAEPAAEGTVYLVCTSAGEVGVNLSADHLVCDLSTFDSMAQRFGRVNRFGERPDTEVDVVHSAKFEKDNERDQRRAKTLELLRGLNGSASPNALRAIATDLRQAAFAPPPKILPVSDILFDAWSLTTITGFLPGRPKLAPYLHGVTAYEPPQTQVAWREEVWKLRDLVPDALNATELLADYPLKPHELLKDVSSRVADALTKLVARDPNKGDLPFWLADEEGTVELFTLGQLLDKRMKERLNGRTVLLPPQAGGLRGGLLDATATEAVKDLSDEWLDDEKRPRRLRVWVGEEDAEDLRRMRLICEIDTDPLREDDSDDAAEAEITRRFWRWYELARSADSEGSRSAREDILLEKHTRSVELLAHEFAKKSGLPPELIEAVRLAGKFHDLGKRRRNWQLSIGKSDPNCWFAKSKRGGIPYQLDHYRHEFGSLLDLETEPEFLRLSEEMKDLVLHLVAAHHGRARPHFLEDEASDVEHPAQRSAALAAETPRRFARLQRKFGRWHLAWLESLLRAADYAASADPDITVEEQP